MSARYSKTSWRGRAMITSALTGSTRRDSTRGAPSRISGRVPGDAADGVAALEVPHELDGVGLGPALRGAQRADGGRASEAVHALADQRGAAAVRARVAPRRERADRLAQQRRLEVGLRQGPQRTSHARRFAAALGAPAAAPVHSPVRQAPRGRCPDGLRVMPGGYAGTQL